MTESEALAELDSIFAESAAETEARIDATPGLRKRLREALAAAKERRKLSTDEWVALVLPSFLGED